MEIRKTARLLPVLCLLGSTAMAEGVYVGAKVGVMDPDINGMDEATNAGVVLGYTFGGDGNISWAAEAEFTTTISDGDIEVFGQKGDWDVDTQALYGVLRFGSDIYGKVRAGYLREDVSASIAGVSVDDDDTGFSGGLGAGWRMNENFAIELEYTFIEDDLDFYSAGLNYSF